MQFQRLELDQTGKNPELIHFLEAHSNPFDDLSVWASALSGPPKQVWAALEHGAIAAIASLCGISEVDKRVFWSVKGNTHEAERLLIEHLVGVCVLEAGVTVCPEHLVPLYERFGAIAYRKSVRHLGLPISSWTLAAAEVYRPSVEELSAFYAKWQNKNWHEGQYLRGPHVGVRHAGELIAAGGTQATFPGVLHIGNAFVDPEYRGRGVLKRAIAGLFNIIAHEHPGAMVSAYVGDEAAFTVPTYEKMGLTVRHTLTELEWTAHA